MSFLRFHDEDGDPIYVKNDIIGIFTVVDKTTIQSFMGREQVVHNTAPTRGIISQSTGKWEVTESYEEILDQIEAVPCG